jgi:hypothetical protein
MADKSCFNVRHPACSRSEKLVPASMFHGYANFDLNNHGKFRMPLFGVNGPCFLTQQKASFHFFSLCLYGMTSSLIKEEE